MSGSFRAWSSLLAALLCALSLPAAAQENPGVLTVTVRVAETQQPVAGAQVLVQGVGMAGTTGSDGRVRMVGLTPGSRIVTVRFLGYQTAHATVVLPASAPASVGFDLETRPVQLSEVEVVARPRRSPLLSNGFYDRQRQGSGGVFIARDEIVRMQPRHLSDVLRRVPGVTLTPTVGGMSRASLRGRNSSGCAIQYFVDGVQVWRFNVDDVRPDDVEGVEIYRGGASLPAQYNRGTANCGVILIWTRIQ